MLKKYISQCERKFFGNFDVNNEVCLECGENNPDLMNMCKIASGIKINSTLKERLSQNKLSTFRGTKR